MGANYDFVIIGRRLGQRDPFQHLLHSTGRFVNENIGPLKTGMLLDLPTGLMREFPVSEEELKKVMNIKPTELLSLYSEDKSRPLLYSACDQYWEISCALPADAPNLDDLEAESIFKNFWLSLIDLVPSFGVAGEELTVSDEECASILGGTLFPTELPLCDMVIIENGLVPEDKSGSATRLENALFFRQSFFSGNMRIVGVKEQLMPNP